MTSAGTETDRAALLGLLEWYAEMGADAALEDAPQNRFAESAAPPAARPVRTIPSASQSESQRQPPALLASLTPVSPEEAAASARELARQAGSLEELRILLDAFDGCTLKQSASRLVFADGNPQARVMLVGEAPGRDEDEQGLPFVGRAGQLLNRMLAAIGLDRTSTYIANVVPWRPPGNRTPTPQEIAICLPFIARQIELVAPDILVCVGAPSSQTLLNQRDGILRLRGRWFDYQAGARTIPAVATLHPAYLLRQPAQKKMAWRDLRALEERFRGLPEK